MWKEVIEYTKQLLTLTRTVQKNKEDIEKLSSEVKELRQEVSTLRQEFINLVRVVERLVYDIQRDRDKADADRRILLLEIENAFSASSAASRPANRKRMDRDGDATMISRRRYVLGGL
jgi:chromosome segregation ATPase